MPTIVNVYGKPEVDIVLPRPPQHKKQCKCGKELNTAPEAYLNYICYLNIELLSEVYNEISKTYPNTIPLGTLVLDSEFHVPINR